MARPRAATSGSPRRGAAATQSRISYLGPLTIDVGGQTRPLGGLRQRAVLALLAIKVNEVVSQDALIDGVWGGEPPSSAVSTLQGYVSLLKRALAGSEWELGRKGPGYQLSGDPEKIDARVFGSLVGEAQRALTAGRPVTTVEFIDQALALWRGPALAEFAYEEFARTEAGRLEEARLLALGLRVEGEMALGHHQVAAAQLEQLVAEYPLREDYRGQLMRALAAGGRRVEALRTYQEGRRLFADELGLDPSLSLQRLERAILAQDPSLEPSSGPTAPAVQLPAATTSFVGREDELKEVAELLERRRLVTITGPGGIGKTRLAVELARSLAADHPDGVFLVELAELTDPKLVVPTVARALGAQVQADHPALDTLEQAVAHRSCLVVVDNCEHLVEAAATAVSALLRAGTAVRVLTTSRQPLVVTGEAIWALAPLDLPQPGAGVPLEEIEDSDAVRLFAERADTAWPGFVVSPDNVAFVAGICQRLDGIPLAIELAAARLRTLSVEQISQRLDDRFKLLTTGDRSAPARYRTLQASLEWSYDLLDEEERTLFRRMSVFAGSFDLGAVEAVCSGGPISVDEIVTLIGELIDKSLLARVIGPEGEPRYRLLETLRDFGLRLLSESGDEPVLRAEHARAFTERSLSAVGRLHGPDTQVWVGQLDADRPDIRAALEWLVENGEPADALRLATGLWLYWRYRDEPAEGRAWVERSLVRGQHDAAARLEAAVARARLALLDDDPQGAEDACAEGIELDPGEDGWARPHFQAVRAELLRFQGLDRDGAGELAADAVAGFHRLGDRYWEAHARRVLGLIAWDKGDLTRAATLAGQCLTLFEGCGDSEGMAGAKIMLAGLARDQGDALTATRLYDESLTAFRAIDQPWGQAEAARHFGTLVLAAGDEDLAETLGLESLRLCEHLGLGRGIGQSCELLARVALERGQLDEASEIAERGLEQLRSYGYPGDVAPLACTAAHVALHQGDPVKATTLVRETMGPAQGFGYRRNPSLALSLLARARARTGDAGAVALGQEAVDLARSAGDARGTAFSLEALAEAILLLDQSQQAARLLLVARYTRQSGAIEMTRAEQRDHEWVVAAVRERLGDDAFAVAWWRAWENEVIDMALLESLTATPDELLGAPAVSWEGSERRGSDRRQTDRREVEPEVDLSPTADRRRLDRRRWQRRRTDRVP